MGRRGKASILAILAEALRGVLRHKTRSALNAVGIMIGIASVVWVVGIGRAGSERAQASLQALGDNLVWVEAGSRNVNGVRTGTHGTISLTVEDGLAIAREVPEITRMSPQVDGSAVVAAGDRNWSTRYRGIDSDYLPIKRWEIGAGAMWGDDQRDRASNVCLIGETVRARLFGADDPVGKVIRVAGQPFDVVGVLVAKGQSGTGQDQDDTLMVPYTTAQKKLRGGGVPWVDDILCSASSPENVLSATARITELMRERHHIQSDQDDDFNIRHPEELIKAQIEASHTLSALLVSIASVSLLVGGIGVMNVMLASVVERTREIGVRLAVGAPEWAVGLQFMAEAVLLSVFGGALGVGVSAAGASAIGKAVGWPLTVSADAVGVAATFSLCVGVVFGFFPARQASKMEPIVALRSD